MFFEGTLTEGITKAVNESKAIVCYVTDDRAESKPIEGFLQDEKIIQTLIKHAVTLKLQTGSTEAGYLSIYCPIDDAPLLVVIRGGALKDVLKSDLGLGEFASRLESALAAESVTDAPSSTPVAGQTSNHVARPENFEGPDLDAQEEQGARNENLDEVFAERRVKLEAQKKAQDAKDKEDRLRKAKERKDAAEAEITRDPDSKRARELKYAKEQRRIKQQAAAERERIMRAIADDKAARKEKDELSRQLRELHRTEATNRAQSEVEEEESPVTVGDCAIQVRLFDGTAIRSRFPAESTLSQIVRPWIDQQRVDGDAPYTFKQAVHPPPYRVIDDAEEHRSLAELDLLPSATLVLSPIKDHVSAYDQGGGILYSGYKLGYGIVSSVGGMVSSAVSSVVGGGSRESGTDQNDQTKSESSDKKAQQQEANAPTGNIRTLRDANARKDDRQYYNGNQLNFEPRKDD